MYSLERRKTQDQVGQCKKKTKNQTSLMMMNKITTFFGMETVLPKTGSVVDFQKVLLVVAVIKVRKFSNFLFGPKL